MNLNEFFWLNWLYCKPLFHVSHSSKWAFKDLIQIFPTFFQIWTNRPQKTNMPQKHPYFKKINKSQR